MIRVNVCVHWGRNCTTYANAQTGWKDDSRTTVPLSTDASIESIESIDGRAWTGFQFLTSQGRPMGRRPMPFCVRVVRSGLACILIGWDGQAPLARPNTTSSGLTRVPTKSQTRTAGRLAG